VEIREKTRAYLKAGAQEVWIVTETGDWHVFTAEREDVATAFAVTLPNLAAQART
jgi:hypothetical protein